MIKVKNSCVGVIFLAFNALLHTKSEYKVIGKKYTFTICVGCVLIIIGNFLFENQIFNGLLEVIGIQTAFILYRVGFPLKI